MARNFEFIKDITDRKDIWKVAVKVKDKWSAMKDVKEYFEMVVCDAKGCEEREKKMTYLLVFQFFPSCFNH
ncbi:hypothetical protein P8452_38038 [Trifolium repens]|nr:hypothetical protein P8452_38038 [Trifolium repens]